MGRGRCGEGGGLASNKATVSIYWWAMMGATGVSGLRLGVYYKNRKEMKVQAMSYMYRLYAVT